MIDNFLHFSVIIPLFNKEETIRSTIYSVLDQTYPYLELIIVNDGSTDNSISKIQSIKDDRLKIINQDNLGVSSARNRGIREAKFNWITFLDGDDLWKKNHLAEYYEIIKANNRTTWIISGFETKNGHQIKNSTFTKNGFLQNVIEDLAAGLRIHTSTVCVKKDLFDQHNDLYFREGLNNSEDREVWYKLCCIDKTPYYISKCLSVYNLMVTNSLTKNNTEIHKDHFLSMHERIISFSLYDHLNETDKLQLSTVISDFNKKAIKLNYINGTLKKDYSNYMSKFQYLVFQKTVHLPILIKKILARIV